MANALSHMLCMLYTASDALRWSISVANALNHMHCSEPTVLHRDIKVDNILLDFNTSTFQLDAKLSDFGLHQILDERKAPAMLVRRASLGGVSLPSPLPVVSQKSLLGKLHEGGEYEDTDELARSLKLALVDTTRMTPKVPGLSVSTRSSASSSYYSPIFHPDSPKKEGESDHPTRAASSFGANLSGRTSCDSRRSTPRRCVSLLELKPNAARASGSKLRRSTTQRTLPVTGVPQNSSFVMPNQPRARSQKQLHQGLVTSPRMSTPLTEISDASCRSSRFSLVRVESCVSGNILLGGDCALSQYMTQANAEDPCVIVPNSLWDNDHAANALEYKSRVNAEDPCVIVTNSLWDNDHAGHALKYMTQANAEDPCAIVENSLWENDHAGNALKVELPDSRAGSGMSKALQSVFDQESGAQLSSLYELDVAVYDLAFNLTGMTGSIFYMAPEVYLRQPYNEKADVFSFGVVLYELFSSSLLALECMTQADPFNPMAAAQAHAKLLKPMQSFGVVLYELFSSSLLALECMTRADPFNPMAAAQAHAKVRPGAMRTAVPEVRPGAMRTAVPEVRPGAMLTAVPEVRPGAMRTAVPEVRPGAMRTAVPEKVSEGWRPARTDSIADNLWELIQSCWQQNPGARADIGMVLEELWKIQAKLKIPAPVPCEVVNATASEVVDGKATQLEIAFTKQGCGCTIC
eukprot:gene1273-32623_t